MESSRLQGYANPNTRKFQFHLKQDIDAQTSAAKGKHFESLPAIWRELRRAFLQGCWRPQRVASIHMARQCLQLNLPHDAAFHALIARDEEAAKQVGDFLVRFGTHSTLAGTLEKVLLCGQLNKLFITSCDLLAPMVDAIPDAFVERVLEWLLAYAGVEPTNIVKRQAMQKAWETLRALAYRLDDKQSRRLALVAIAHPSWSAVPEQPNQVIPVRKTMLEAICNAAHSMLPATAKEVAQHVVVVATEQKRDLDYADAVEALCQLAGRGGAGLKAQLRKSLYPKGQRLNTILLQVTSAFGQAIKRTELLAKDAQRVAERLRLQVQRIPDGAQPPPAPARYFTITANQGNQKVVVHMTDARDVIAIFRHRHAIDRKSLDALILTVLDMLHEQENLLVNKFFLVESLSMVGDVLSRAIARKVFDVVSPFAQGQIAEPTCVMSAAEAEDPLNPFKLRTGKPSELRGISLLALACIERDQPGVFGVRLSKLIDVALTDPNAIVRSFSLAAAQEMSQLSITALTAVLLATRDPNPETSSAAFSVIATRANGQLDHVGLRLVIQCLNLGADANDVRVRRAAARAVARLSQMPKTKGLAHDHKVLRERFSKDRCYSVRQAVAARKRTD
jgi:hypothetical protein